MKVFETTCIKEKIIAEAIEETTTEETAIDTTPIEELEKIALGKLKLMCESAEETKAHDIRALDVRGQTPLADFFVICSGTSVTHIKSIAENVQDKLREESKVRAKPQGGAESFWMILDYGDVILHVFDEETRAFYDLERLWSEAKPIDWNGAGEENKEEQVSAES